MDFTAIKLAAFTVSLGMDTFVVAISLGVRRTSDMWRIAGIFGSVQVAMVTFGLLMGHAMGQFLGEWASVAGGLALLALGVWMVFFDHDDEGGEEGERELAGSSRTLRWRLLWAAALSVSIDELAGGFSMGFTGIPLLWTILLIGAQGIVLTLARTLLGRRIRPRLGSWAHRVPGIILGALSMGILIGEWKLF